MKLNSRMSILLMLVVSLLGLLLVNPNVEAQIAPTVFQWTQTIPHNPLDASVEVPAPAYGTTDFYVVEQRFPLQAHPTEWVQASIQVIMTQKALWATHGKDAHLDAEIIHSLGCETRLFMDYGGDLGMHSTALWLAGEYEKWDPTSFPSVDQTAQTFTVQVAPGQPYDVGLQVQTRAASEGLHDDGSQCVGSAYTIVTYHWIPEQMGSLSGLDEWFG